MVGVWQIFSYGKLADFLAFCDKNPDVVKEHSIDKEKAVRDMRILSLSLLASEYEEIPYDEVAATLKVPKVRTQPPHHGLTDVRCPLL